VRCGSKQLHMDADGTIHVLMHMEGLDCAYVRGVAILFSAAGRSGDIDV
jgi:hypothetical protein